MKKRESYETKEDGAGCLKKDYGAVSREHIRQAAKEQQPFWPNEFISELISLSAISEFERSVSNIL